MTQLISKLLVVACIALLIGLGFWQLQRAEQKQLLIDQQNAQFSRPAIELHVDRDRLDAVRFQHVFVRGHFDCARQLLLENKIHKGRPGFHVVTAFHPETAVNAILINRGWVSMDSKRAPAPRYLDCPQGDLSIQGVATGFPGLGFYFSGSTAIQSNAWPKRLLALDAGELSTVLGYPVVDYLLLMDESIPGGFARDWHFAPTISPQKHVAYAVQWFGLALTLCALIFYRWRNTNDTS